MPAGRGPATLLAAPGETAPAEGPLDLDLKDVTTSSVEAYRAYAQGVELNRRSRSEEALPFFEKAVTIDPTFALAHAKMAVAAHNIARSDLRDAAVARALQHLDRLTELERLYIQAFSHTGRPVEVGKGIELYEQLLARYPRHAASRNNLATLYAIREQFDDAIRHLEILRESGFEFRGIYDQLAIAYTSLGRGDDALAVYDQYSARFPAEPYGPSGRGMTLLELGRYDEAMRAFDRALGLRPDLLEGLQGRITTALFLEQWDTALTHARAMQAAKSPNSARWGFKGEALLALFRGRSADALKLLERAAVLEGGGSGNNESAATRGLMSEVLLARDDNAAAIAMADRGIAESPGTAGANWSYGAKAVAATRLGRTSVAASALAPLEQRADLSGLSRIQRQVFLFRGRMALQSGRLEEAVELLQRATTGTPPGGIPLLRYFAPDFEPVVWNALGRAYLERGELDQARTVLERLSTSGAKHLLVPTVYVESWYLLGQVAERQGDPTRAKQHYRRFLSYWRDGDLRLDWVREAQRKTGT